MSAKISKKMIITLIVIIIGGMATMSYVFRGAENSVANENAVYTTTADELFSVFEENETAANEKYLGKVVEVTGTIGEIEKTENGQLVLLLTCNSPMGGIRCTFETRQDKVIKQVSQGASCTVKGKCSGMLMEVVLDNCSLTK
jgi:hypothetical protein